MPIRFAEFEIDDTHFELRQNGEAIPSELQTLKLIAFLASHPDEVLDRDTLMANVWPGKVVSDATISGAIKSARKALGDNGKDQRFIQTIHKRGFRFIVPVEQEETHSSRKELLADTLPRPRGAADSLADCLSLGVLAFANLSEDASQQYFADGIRHDIITQLAQFRDLRVVSLPDRADALASQSAGPHNSAQYPADYLLAGGVRRAGDILRITAHIMHQSSGETVWAQKYDRKMEDLFGVQDEVSRAVVSTISGRVNYHRITATRCASSDELTAHDLVLRAQHHHYRMLKNANLLAAELLERALQLDIGNYRAHSLLGVVLHMNYQMRWTRDGQQALARAVQHGREAVRLEPTDSLAFARLGDTLVLCEAYSEAEQHFDTALQLNPNDSETLALYAEFQRSIGDAEAALDTLATVRSYDPFDRQWYPWLQGECLFQLDYDRDAIAAFQRVLEPINDMRLTHAACHARLGDVPMARALVSDYLANARNEMPAFPGILHADWLRFQAPFINSRDSLHRLRMQALEHCWPISQ